MGLTAKNKHENAFKRARREEGFGGIGSDTCTKVSPMTGQRELARSPSQRDSETYFRRHKEFIILPKRGKYPLYIRLFCIWVTSIIPCYIRS